MSKNDLTAVRAPKLKTSVIATKRTKGRLAKLKTSSWYEVLRDQLGSTKKGRPKSAGEGSQLAQGRFGTSLPRIAIHHALISGLLTGHSGPEPVVFCCAFGLRLTPNRHKAVGSPT